MRMSSKSSPNTNSENYNCQPSYNPFEVDICSLSLPACSPDVFSITKNDNKTPQKGRPDDYFRWSIDQVAAIKPANLDENSNQTVMDRWDDEKECKAQKAIQTFFLHNSICPSPWNAAMTFKHVTFSPNLASTAYYSRSESPFNASKESDSAVLTGKKNAWTQTTLVIPTDVDILHLLGRFYTFLEDQKNQNIFEDNDDAKDFSNTSLRRKLFSPNRFQMPEFSSECGSLPLAKSPQFCTPERNGHCKPSPSSVGTYFSSSPISRRNCSYSPLEQNMSSPPVSPIPPENKRDVKTNERTPHVRLLPPSTPSTKKGSYLKSFLRSLEEETEGGLGKQLPMALSVSFSSKLSDEDVVNYESQDPMDDEDSKHNFTQSSEMQVSVVQYSSDEKNHNPYTGVSTFQPSMGSQDLGYKTESYQLSMETGTHSNTNESSSGKEQVLARWSHKYSTSDVRDSAIESSDSIKLHSRTGGLDSVLVSQSNWKPHTCISSTPH